MAEERNLDKESEVRRNPSAVCKMCLLLAIPLAAYSAESAGCTPVAKLIYYSSQDKKLVSVLRADTKSERGSPTLDQLCSGDRVKVEKGGRVSIKYYSTALPETDLAGEAEFPVYELKANTKISNLAGAVLDIGKWFQGTQGGMTASMTTRSSGSSERSVIRTPLDRGEGEEYPFYLRADLKTLHFFWRGGKAPWTVELRDKTGNKLSSISTTTPQVVLAMQGLKVSEIHAIAVVSSDEKVYKKPIHFVEGGVSGVEVEQLQQVVELLYLDSEENWRLQLWSTLQGMPDSSVRSTLMDHLEKDDL